jgi:cytochrome bd-type quinol oxidase subunit 2
MNKQAGERVLFLTAAVFAAFTGCWIVVGVANNGDAFPQGMAVPMLPFVVVGPALVGWRLRRSDPKRYRGLVIVTTLLAVAFWLLVPSGGWWARGPR